MVGATAVGGVATRSWYSEPRTDPSSISLMVSVPDGVRPTDVREDEDVVVVSKMTWVGDIGAKGIEIFDSSNADALRLCLCRSSD